MMFFSQWKTIGYAAALFVAGGISGGALGVYETNARLFAPPREQEVALRIGQRFQQKLGLSDDQMVKIKPIIESAAKEIHAIRMETAQQTNKIFEDSYAQLAAILTPEQRQKLEEMKKERRARSQEWRLRQSGPGGPHQGQGPGQGPPGHDGPPGQLRGGPGFSTP